MSLHQYLEAIQSATQNLSQLVKEAKSRNAFVEAAAQDLVARISDLLSYRVVEANTSSNICVTVFDALPVTLAFAVQNDDPNIAPLLELWGKAVQSTWQESNRLEAVRLLEQLTTIVGELWENTKNSDSALGLVCRRIVDAMPGIDRVSVVISDKQEQEGTVIAAFPADTVGQSLRLDSYDLYSRLKTTKAPVVISDAKQESEQFGPNRGLLAAFAVQSILIVPLMVEGKLMGSIGFDAIKQQHHFSEEEIRLLQAAVHQIGLFIKNYKVTQLPTDTINEGQQQLVDQIMQSIPLRSDIETLMMRTAESVGQLLNASAVNIYLNPQNSVEKSSQDEKAD